MTIFVGWSAIDERVHFLVVFILHNFEPWYSYELHYGDIAVPLVIIMWASRLCPSCDGNVRRDNSIQVLIFLWMCSSFKALPNWNLLSFSSRCSRVPLPQFYHTHQLVFELEDFQYLCSYKKTIFVFLGISVVAVQAWTVRFYALLSSPRYVILFLVFGFKMAFYSLVYIFQATLIIYWRR